MDGQLDVHLLNKLETDLKDVSFKRVDADVVDKLIQKDEVRDSKLTAEQQKNIVPVFSANLPQDANYIVSVENLNEQSLPITITQSEFMRRMVDMSELQGGMSFYGNLPTSYNLVLNSNSPLIVNIAKDIDKKLSKDLKEIDAEIEPLQKEFDEISTTNADKKEEELSEEVKSKREEITKKLDEAKAKREAKLKEFGKDKKIIKQIIDLGLLANQMLKGEALTKFVKRSVDLLK